MHHGRPLSCVPSGAVPLHPAQLKEEEIRCRILFEVDTASVLFQSEERDKSARLVRDCKWRGCCAFGASNPTSRSIPGAGAPCCNRAEKWVRQCFSRPSVTSRFRCDTTPPENRASPYLIQSNLRRITEIIEFGD